MATDGQSDHAAERIHDVEDVVEYGLGTYVAVPPSFNMLIPIELGEYEELDAGLGRLASLTMPFHFKLVERNHVELLSIHQFAAISISLGRAFAAGDHRALGEAVMTATVNWLTSVRLFLDHVQTDLNARFGRRSEQAARFKSATNAAYDRYVGYRFIYKFRNYVQHCGLPLSKIEVSRDPRGGVARQKVDLLLSREDLLSKYSGWGPVAADLRNMQPEFGLLPLAEEAMSGLRLVYGELLESQLDEALAVVPALRIALDRIAAQNKDGQPAFYRFQSHEGTVRNVTPHFFPVDAIVQLEAVQAGTTDRASLFETSTEPELKFDPATVRERFHRDQRGVQILTAWLEERGGTERFFQIVNTIVQSDGSFEPLMTGLINMSVVLANIAAGALGMSAEGLTAGLLDVYSQYEVADPNNRGVALEDLD